MSTKRKAVNNFRFGGRPGMMKNRHSRAESERDSGFSDASSEHMSTMETTDSDDSPHTVSKQGSQATRSGSQPSQLTVVGGSYSGLPPMIIMNNVLLKQPENPPPLKPWGFSPTVEVMQPVVQQPQVVFIQPVVSNRASPASKEVVSKHRRSKKHLPILKSYPKIAPHPGDNTSSSGRGTASSTSSSSGSDSCSSLTSNQRDKMRKTLCGSTSESSSSIPSPSTMSSLLSVPTSDTSNNASPAKERPSSTSNQAEFAAGLSFSNKPGSKNKKLPISQTASTESSSSGDNSLSGSDCDTKRKRFCNTYNILSKSGLLDITLRTKELLRQNRRTQNDLDRLKEQTELFLEALQSGDTSIFVKLQTSLQEEERENSSDQFKSRLDLV